MCPACIATAALIAGSVTGAGGVAALVVNKFCARNAATKIPARNDSTAREISPGGTIRFSRP
jgi:hypothetical protein